MKKAFPLLLAAAIVLFLEFDVAPKTDGFINRELLPAYRQYLEPWLSDLDIQGLPLPQKEVVTPGPGTPARVTRVIDGDTIDVLISGQEERVRYISINTPERDEPCFQEATAANRRLLGRNVTLVADTRDRDNYGRLLRYVYVGDTLVERELVRQGMAEAVLYGKDDRHYREFSELEKAAAALELGCHATGIFDDGDLRR